MTPSLVPYSILDWPLSDLEAEFAGCAAGRLPAAGTFDLARRSSRASALGTRHASQAEAAWEVTCFADRRGRFWIQNTL
jgi:hypothetical protein